jgi:hypothetical protein
MRFDANPGFEREIQADPDYQAGITRVAEEARTVVEQLTHHIMPRYRTRMIRLVREGGETFVVNTNYGGHLDEWGSIHNPPYAPMRRGIRAAGLRLDESPKP